MVGNTFSPDNCKWCGGRRTIRHTGRPGEYCSTKCRQTAHTQRQKPPPDTSQFDAFLRVELSAVQAEVRDLQRALNTPTPDAGQPLERLLQLQRRVEQLLPPVVGRTKRMGVSWEVIGRMLGMSKDTVRKKFSSSVVQRALSRAHIRVPAPRTAPQSPPPPAATPPPGTPFPSTPVTVVESPADSSVEEESADPAPEPGPPGPLDFACVLSNLQRASGLTLRALSKKSSLSPSFLSRAMNGERFPSWEATAALARACGADPEVLRKVWEDADARRSRKAAKPEVLASALRHLHHRAGSPTPWSVHVNSGYALSQELVTALLEGTTAGTWEDVQILVQTLDGEYTYFEPLWHQAIKTMPETEPTNKPSTPPPVTDPGPATRVEDLIAAFGKVLGAASNRPSSPGRSRPTPIQAATTWTIR
ncbi:helix-turn-helix transcriptional regulator [Streptomyces griseus]|uniref:Helix-turn-helix transcriptional regulator n=1 Tax=Streptomyces stephensoniae TaxID=3375367 RepID=A0ABU2W756_9ACTN|nr:helix-turn-helix transcriptional regulator [Streptomyces griseus]MDT0493710.1 helix-turn-helix transcriptional regulator [Streptomyces griseus]